MVFKLGYNNTESESKLYFRYEYKQYNLLLYKFLKHQSLIALNNKPLIVDFNIIKSATTTKVGTIFKNILFFNFNNYSIFKGNNNNNINNNNSNVWSLDLDIATKRKMIKYVNFDILPIIKLSFNNVNIPLTINIKTGHYQGSKEQIFDNYDYSLVLKSLLPCFKSSVSIVNTNSYLLRSNDILFLYKLKLSGNKITNYESSIKGLISLKAIFDLKQFKLFTLNVCNEMKLRNAYIIKTNNSNKNKVNNKLDVNTNHVTSTYECKSKICNFNILNDNDNKIIDNGLNYFIQNNLILKLKDLPLFKQNEMLNRINPYLGIETIFHPLLSFNNDNHKNKRHSFDFNNYLKFIFTVGVSLQINEYVSIDLSFYTWTLKNSKQQTNKDDNIINRFRVNLEISTNID